MRVIVFSDLHLHNWNYGAGYARGGYNTRLIQQYEVVKDLIEYAKSNNILNVFFAGDWFHTHARVDTSVLQIGYQLVELFDQNNINLYMIVGNHDQANREGTIYSTCCLIPPATKISDPSVCYDIEGLPIVGLDYTENKLKLAEFWDRIPKGSLVFLHQGVAGVPMHTGYLIDEIFEPEMLPAHVLHCFTGHYHNHKEINSKLTIPGSPMQHNWGDVGQPRGWLDVTIDSSGVQIKHILSNSHKFLVLKKDMIEHANLMDNFVKVIDCEQDDKDIWDACYARGAVFVTLSGVDTHKTTQPEIGDSRELTLEELLHEWEDKKNISSELIQVGKDIREDKVVIDEN